MTTATLDQNAAHAGESAPALTELEAHVLAQIAVHQPVSAYDVMKALANSFCDGDLVLAAMLIDA